MEHCSCRRVQFQDKVDSLLGYFYTMNTQTFANHSKQIEFALLATATIGAIASPAQADDASI